MTSSLVPPRTLPSLERVIRRKLRQELPSWTVIEDFLLGDTGMDYIDSMVDVLTADWPRATLLRITQRRWVDLPTISERRELLDLGDNELRTLIASLVCGGLAVYASDRAMDGDDL